MISLVELDSLEATVIVDNELDPLSSIAPNTVQVQGAWVPEKVHLLERGNAIELLMESLCCGAHGLSVLSGTLL